MKEAVIPTLHHMVMLLCNNKKKKILVAPSNFKLLIHVLNPRKNKPGTFHLDKHYSKKSELEKACNSFANCMGTCNVGSPAKGRGQWRKNRTSDECMGQSPLSKLA